MNHEQFKIWEKQKWREYGSELIKLEEDFAGRGLAFSGMRNKEKENLKAKYESEIEITRLGTQNNKKDMYLEILEWANNKNVFNLQELYDKFPSLNSDLKNWFLITFRGASNNDDCLIGLGYDDNRLDYYYLTAKGRSVYQNSNQNKKIDIRIEKLEATHGDRVNGNKIEQPGDKNKANINYGTKENFFSKLFWYGVIPFLVGLAIIYFALQFGWN